LKLLRALQHDLSNREVEISLPDAGRTFVAELDPGANISIMNAQLAISLGLEVESCSPFEIILAQPDLSIKIDKQLVSLLPVQLTADAIPFMERFFVADPGPGPGHAIVGTPVLTNYYLRWMNGQVVEVKWMGTPTLVDATPLPGEPLDISISDVLDTPTVTPSVSSVIPIGDKLTSEERAASVELLNSFEDIFGEISPSPMVVTQPCRVILKPQAQPFRAHVRYLARPRMDWLEKHLHQLEDLDIVRKSTPTEWAAPITIVPKSDSSFRLCIDYTELNKYGVSPSGSQSEVQIT